LAKVSALGIIAYMVRFVLKFVVLSVLLSAVMFLQIPLAEAATQNHTLALLDQKVQARSALLVDAVSGKVLFRRNPAETLPPASTVKLLTALLVYPWNYWLPHSASC